MADDEPAAGSESEREKVRDWRLAALLQAGIEVGWAEVIADDTASDLHETIEAFGRLTANGATSGEAARILAPLAATVKSPTREHFDDSKAGVRPRRRTKT